MQWSNMSNIEIRIKISSMEEEYESIKNQINNLIDKLDSLDNEYNNAKKELEKRNKK